MRKFLLWISLWLAVLSVSAQQAAPSGTLFSFDKEKKATYNLFIRFEKGSLTGICFIKSCEGGLVGSVMNEFSIKAFDFVYRAESQKVRLFHLVGFMNKWYIKRILKKDWSYLLAYPQVDNKDKRRKITVTDNGAIVLENRRYRICYTFIPLDSVK